MLMGPIWRGSRLEAGSLDVSFLLRGLVIGFSIAAPVGPIGVLCIQRTLTRGRAAGLISGFGTATADALYGSIAGFGLTLVSTVLISWSAWIELVGGVFLCCLGLKNIIFPRPAERTGLREATHVGDYASAFFLTLTNPLTILSFVGIFAGLGLAGTGGNYFLAMLLVVGVFSGSVLWWFILSGAVQLFRGSFDAGRLLWVNRVSGLIILLFGFVALVSSLGVLR